MLSKRQPDLQFASVPKSEAGLPRHQRRPRTAKLLGSLELLTQTLSQFVSLCFAFRQANAFIPKKLIHALNMGGEFLDLRLVASFGLRKMGVSSSTCALCRASACARSSW